MERLFELRMKHMRESRGMDMPLLGAGCFEYSTGFRIVQAA